MSYVTTGSVSGCGLAPGPALQLSNWSGYVINGLPVIWATIKSPKRNAKEVFQFSWTDSFIILLAVKSFCASIYGWYEYAQRSGIPALEPTAFASVALLGISYYRLNRAPWVLISTMILSSLHLASTIYAVYILSLRNYFFIDISKLPQCMSPATNFGASHLLALKHAMVGVSMAGASVSVVQRLWFVQDEKIEGEALAFYEDLSWSYQSSIIFTLIGLPLVILDLFFLAGKEFTCGGCSVSSRYGYYDYQVNSFMDSAGYERVVGFWYKFVNACGA